VNAPLRAAVATAAFLLSGAAAAQPAQSLSKSYARVVAIVNGTTAYVGGSLLGCAAANVLTEQQAEERFTSYQARNATLAARVEAWRKDAESRLRAQGAERAAKAKAEEAGLSAIAGSSDQAEREIGAAPDKRAFCDRRVAAIEAGAADLARNPELRGLLAK